MRLDRLLAQAGVRGVLMPGASRPESLHATLAQSDISSVHCRAQNVKPGGLFVAIRGFAADGHDFAPTAVEQGAVVVVAERPMATEVPVVLVDDSRRALAVLATEFYGRPAARLVVVGITGTNGKTTTAYLVEGILAEAGRSAGVIGTVNARYAGKIFDNPVTTPESIDLQRMLADMEACGVTHVVMEVSSHALALNRIEGCLLDVGVFTNLTRDHLDFHGDIESYWACKRELFLRHLGPENPKPGKVGVINTDDPRGAVLCGEFSGTRITTGLGEGCDVRPREPELRRRGIRTTVLTPRGPLHVSSPLVGAHNLENILSAVGVGLALKIDPETIERGIGKVSHIPGRLEPVASPDGRFVFVDYAHTPDALENVLLALRPLCPGRLVCVFGCGGDRDRGKRPQMGAIASQLSDLTVVTSDNPRTEDPLKIIEEILAGISKNGIKRYEPGALTAHYETGAVAVEPDRRKAIALASACSRPGDTVLIAGKGHETYQIIGRQRLPFDDRKEASRALQCGN